MVLPDSFFKVTPIFFLKLLKIKTNTGNYELDIKAANLPTGYKDAPDKARAVTLSFSPKD